MSKNKLGVCEWILPVRGTEAIAYAAKAGFDGIQLMDCGGYNAGYPLLNPNIQRSYLEAAEKYKIELQALHLWTLCREAGMIHPITSEAGKVSLRSIQSGLEVCAALHIPNLLLTSGFMCQIKNEQDFQRFAAMLKKACKMAADKNVTVVFESALQVDDILRMREIVGADLKICYDVFNPIRFSVGNPLEEIPKLGTGAINHFHLKDGPENCIGCTLLGKGIGQFNDVVRTIKNIGYSGWLMTENYYSEPPMPKKFDPLELTMMDLATMREVFG